MHVGTKLPKYLTSGFNTKWTQKERYRNSDIKNISQLFYYCSPACDSAPKYERIQNTRCTHNMGTPTIAQALTQIFNILTNTHLPPGIWFNLDRYTNII